MEESKGDYGAFIQRFLLQAPSPPPLPSSDSSTPQQLTLQGLTFAVKDIFDVSGYVTGFGNPDWARTHAAATSTSPAVMTTLGAGATCVGKTVMDEMAYSINGQNEHYGTPINPCAPDRVPGGSSSGSAVAVAAGLVDFSLGTDTGGSVRVPAAYCGIFGYRPSHAVVSTSDVIPMAQSFDAVGWFARDPTTLSKVGQTLLPLPAADALLPNRIIIADDCFLHLSSLGDLTRQILVESVKKTIGYHVVCHSNLGDCILNKVPSLSHFMCENSENQGTIPVLLALSNAMRSLQRCEFKHNHAEWVNKVKPNLGHGILQRVWEAIRATEEDVKHCHAVKSELRCVLNTLLEDDGVLVLPTVPGPPPKLVTEAALLEDFRARAFSLLSIAGMSGLCQVAIPLGMHENLPMSVSILARHGADHFLLNLVQTLYGSLREHTANVKNLVH